MAAAKRVDFDLDRNDAVDSMGSVDGSGSPILEIRQKQGLEALEPATRDRELFIATMRRSEKLSRRQKEVADQHLDQGILASWNPTSSRGDVVVAKDGSGDCKTVMDAIASLTKRNLIATSSRARSRSSVLIVYVKEGIYHEHVVIGRHLNHLMFVGDGIDRTIIT
ncbi:hypothetical protein Droror1_Dr00028223, partial [Drosera rotundifolia]